MTVKDRLRAFKNIGRYHAEIAYKKLAGRLHPALRTFPELDDYPEVTIFITNINNRYPLELALRSLRSTVIYPNFRIVIADNGSTDGSVAFVRSLIAEGWPIRLLEHGKPKHQPLWYDQMMEEADTPYWVGIHEDMYFLNDGWLLDLIARMEKQKDIDLLGGAYFAPKRAVREPVKGGLVDIAESLSTWIFCMRTELREKISSTFQDHKRLNEETGRQLIYDQGGKLIEDMRAAGLRYEVMPDWYVLKWQHIANISWGFKAGMSDAVRAYKLHQLRDVERRVEALRARAGSKERVLVQAE